MWELWEVEILVFPLTWHIAYTTACCYRTSRDTATSLKLSIENCGQIAADGNMVTIDTFDSL